MAEQPLSLATEHWPRTRHGPTGIRAQGHVASIFFAMVREVLQGDG